MIEHLNAQTGTFGVLFTFITIGLVPLDSASSSTTLASGSTISVRTLAAHAKPLLPSDRNVTALARRSRKTTFSHDAASEEDIIRFNETVYHARYNIHNSYCCTYHRVLVN